MLRVRPHSPVRLFRSGAASIAAFLLTAALHAADPRPAEAGRPYVRAYSPSDYRGHHQIFNTTQGPDGVMYFANYGQVLEFDGHRWQQIPVPTSWMRQLVAAPDGRIFVGATDELGVCETDAHGILRYRSLVPLLDDVPKPIGAVWGAAWHDGAIWFATGSHVLRWRDGAFKTWRLGNGQRQNLRVVDGQLYLRRRGDGLYRIVGERFDLVTQDPVIAQSDMFMLVPDGAHGLLAGVDDGSLYRLRDGSVTRWTPPAAPFLHEARLRNGLRLRSGHLAVSTIHAGVAILSAEGELLQRVDEASGLPSQITYGLFEDREGGVWVETFSGMARFEPGTAFTLFDGTHGRSAAIIFGDKVRHRGILYAAGTDGLFRLTPGLASRGDPAKWERVEFGATRCTALLVHDGALLAASELGIHILEHGEWRLLQSSPTAVVQFGASVSDPARVFVGLDTGLFTIRRSPEGWRNEGRLAGYDGDAFNIVEDADGSLWVGTTNRGIVRAVRPPGAADWTDARVTTYNEFHGLHRDHGWTRVVETTFGIRFTTNHGTFVFDAAQDRFVPAPEFVEAGLTGLYTHPVKPGPGESLWVQAGPADDLSAVEVGLLDRGRDGRPRWIKLDIGGQRHTGYLGAFGFVWEDPNVLWISGRDAELRVEYPFSGPPSPPPAAVIREVARRDAGRWGAKAGDGSLRLAFSREPLVFTFASSVFATRADVQFQTRLVGYDEAWSEWSPRTQVEFTNLSGGPFAFEVRARQAGGEPGPTARFTLGIQPPWHRSNAAFALGALALLGGVAGFIRWRLARAERERRRLEALVAERTAELDAANKAKSLFLANMSHELRTPLNGVIGYAQVLQKSPDIVPRDRERLRVVEASGEHLLRMINEVLDLSKIEAGKFELRPAPFDLPQLLRDIAAGLQLRAVEKGLAFELHISDTLPGPLEGDAQKLRQVLENLLNNAVKFTARGRVELHVSCSNGGRVSSPASMRGEEAAPPTLFQFTIRDTGVGISPEDRAKLFQPFQQADDGRPPEPGTGLGLAISQRIVSLMGGTIAVESQRGVGSTFVVTVPLAPVAASDPTAAAQPHASIVGYEGPRRRVLIVDDIAVNRAVLADLLASYGFELRQAENGTAGLALAAEFQPQLVFLDLRMPGMSGQELARQLRARQTPAPKLIAMSASVLSLDRADAIAAGCDDFLPKPFHEAAIIEQITRHLDVSWIHAAPVAGSRHHGSPHDAPDPATLERLRAAAQRGEVARLRELIGTLRTRHPAFVHEIEALLASYQMDALRQRLTEHHAQSSSRP